jgi:hypothetical protein
MVLINGYDSLHRWYVARIATGPYAGDVVYLSPDWVGFERSNEAEIKDDVTTPFNSQ